MTRLAQVVGSCREAANQRLWETPHDLLDAEQRAALDGLLEVPDGNRNSHLDRLRRPPVRVSGPAMVDALQRASEILELGFADADTDTDAVPPVSGVVPVRGNGQGQSAASSRRFQP